LIFFRSEACVCKWQIFQSMLLLKWIWLSFCTTDNTTTDQWSHKCIDHFIQGCSKTCWMVILFSSLTSIIPWRRSWSSSNLNSGNFFKTLVMDATWSSFQKDLKSLEWMCLKRGSVSDASPSSKGDLKKIALNNETPKLKTSLDFSLKNWCPPLVCFKA